ncbi:MAG: M48 family metallopeptidase [Pseudomonadota bacterium]|nr:M48 family metallopeptidase [Pseudomonadota bacterium]
MTSSARRGPVRMLLDALQLALFDARPAAPPGNREVVVDGRRIGYRLRRSRRRSIGFRIDDSGLLVTAPSRLPLAMIEAGIVARRRWIVVQLAVHETRRAQAEARRVVWGDGAEIDYLGRKLRLGLGAPGAGGPLVTAGTGGVDRLQLPLPADAAEAQIREATHAWLQRQALTLFAQRCAHYAPRLQVRTTALALSRAKTRWGSASSGGRVRLHWRLIHFPLDIVDYVVVHELAHLREMNHGPAFWSLVRSVLPAADAARETLREQSLNAFD